MITNASNMRDIDLLNVVSPMSGLEPGISVPVETLFSNASRPSVHVIGGGEFLDSITAILGPMSYIPAPVETSTQHTVAEEAGTGTIVVIDGELPDALEICQAMDELVPKILISPETTFSFRAKCAQANVTTVMSAPIDQAEFINWLEHFGGQMSSQPASILLVDDDPLASEVYAEMLRANGMTVSVLNDPFDIITSMERSFFDLVIMDLQMPGTDGIEIAKIIRQHQNHLSIPIVFLSSEEDKQVQMKARQFGGDDFISKRADLDALVALIHLRVQRARVLRNLIERDGLTGLLNHRRFKERVGHEMSRYHRTKLQFCIAMIDVDHFKKVNDTWGHPVGDKVLSILARALVGWVRKTDVVGRYGGEEFAVLLLDTSPDMIFEVMENFRKHFAKMAFDGLGEPFSLTISIGVAGCTADGDSATLFAQADKALYLAKSNGRDQVVIAKPETLAECDKTATAGAGKT